MRVLVAGGAGFIGRTLCLELLLRGDEVVCLDNLMTGSPANLEELARHSSFYFVLADACDPVEVEGPLHAVVNLASPASPPKFEQLSIEILNAGSRGTANLLEVARATGARYLQASTSEVYGDPSVHPQPETYWGKVNPIGLRSMYDEAKRFGEALAMAYHRRHGVDVRIARIFNAYGPGMRPDDGRLVPNFVTQALQGKELTVYGDGTQTRSLCYVDDLVDGLLALLGSDHSAPVNIGNDDERPVGEVAKLIVELTGSTSRISYRPLPKDDPAKRCPDLTVARQVLGWWPATPLRAGLEKTIDWFRGCSKLASG